MRSSLLKTDFTFFYSLSRGALALVSPNSLWLSFVILNGSATVLGRTWSLLMTLPRTFFDTIFRPKVCLSPNSNAYFFNVFNSLFFAFAVFMVFRAEEDRTDWCDVEVRDGLCESEWTDLLLTEREALCYAIFWAKVTPEEAFDCEFESVSGLPKKEKSSWGRYLFIFFI